MSIFRSSQSEGGGISKNAAEKRGFIKCFYLFRSGFWNLFELGLLTSLLRILLLPSGLGEVGYARIGRAVARDRHCFRSDYFDTVKKNWGQALIMGILNDALLALAFFSAYYLSNEQPNDKLDAKTFILLVLSTIAAILIIFIRYYTPAVLIMFNVSLGQLYKNALLLAIAGFFRNLLILVLHLVVYALVLSPMLLNLYIGLGISICLYVVFVPALQCFITQYNIFPVLYRYMIAPFMKEHPGEGEETLKELGLIETEGEVLMSDEIKEPQNRPHN